jgi:hypothetical protein
LTHDLYRSYWVKNEDISNLSVLEGTKCPKSAFVLVVSHCITAGYASKYGVKIGDIEGKAKDILTQNTEDAYNKGTS